MPRFRALLLTCLCLASSLAAQEVLRVAATEKPPVIDGLLEAEEWEGATLLDDFTQVEPTEGGNPTRRTEVRLLVDDQALYLAVFCHHASREEIRANVRARDAGQGSDDRFRILLDTYLDRRNAYWFSVSAGGAKRDALVENDATSVIYEWDGVWEARTRLEATGWSAEIAIPSKTLGMDGEARAFGLNLSRVIKETNETVRWASPTRDLSFLQPSAAGTLNGVGPLDPGLGIDFEPYLNVEGESRREGDDELEFDVGFDLSYRVTSELEATLTVNTDFAEAEVDERVVSLDRFPVFFPEKRDFFLQDAGIFSFGRIQRSPLPFFSRRIGLAADGSPVPILAGLKLTGRVDDVNLGVLGTWMDDAEGVGSKGLGVARASVNVSETLTVGGIATYGDPRTEGENAVVGLDFSHRTNRFLGDLPFRWDGFVLGSHDEPEPGAGRSETDYAFGTRLEIPGDVFALDVGYWEIGEEFQADLGFVRRPGTRNPLATVDYRPRSDSDFIRRYEFAASGSFYWSIPREEIESANLRLQPFGVLFESGDSIRVTWTPRRERLFVPFEISDGVVLPAGTYDFQRFRARFGFSNRRPVSGSFAVEGGSFYSGDRILADATLSVRPADGVALTARWQINDVVLDEGDFTTNLGSLRLRVDFTPRVTWSSLVQYDDISDSIGLNSRLRWIVEPGDEVFFVLDQGYATRDPDGGFDLRLEETRASFKVGLLFRF